MPTRNACRDLWTALDTQTQAILRDDDIVSRTAMVAAAYADLYLERQELVWCGVAAFSSKQVACHMRSNPLIRHWLGRGNAAVFSQLYAPFLFFCAQRADLTECLAHREPAMDYELRSGFNELATGDFLQAAVTILMYEQTVTLQREIYETRLYRNLQPVHRVLQRLRLQPAIEVVFCAGCDAPGAPRTAFGAGNIFNIPERWPFALRCLSGFTALVEKGDGLVRDELTLISRGFVLGRE